MANNFNNPNAWWNTSNYATALDRTSANPNTAIQTWQNRVNQVRQLQNSIDNRNKNISTQSVATAPPPTPTYKFSFENQNNNSGFDWRNIFNQWWNYTPPTAPAPQPVATVQQTQPVNNNAYNYSRSLLNLPSDQEVLNKYNAWRKANPKAAGQDWKMELPNGVTLTEQNVNNILNPYGVGTPEGVPDYVPEDFANRQLLRFQNPNSSEAQLQAIQNRWQPNYSAWLGNYQISR